MSQNTVLDIQLPATPSRRYDSEQAIFEEFTDIYQAISKVIEAGDWIKYGLSSSLDVEKVNSPYFLGTTFKVLCAEQVDTNDIGNINILDRKFQLWRAISTNEQRWANCYVVQGAVQGQHATVGILTGVVIKSGLTPGANYFLDATSGGITTSPVSPPTARITQLIGVAASATEFLYEYHVPVLRS